ncbi:MAG: exo-alpha-sialidase [Acidobacteriales bacterium]|nr:exo-alpha-sialidase [Terriglobales bacterium]
MSEGQTQRFLALLFTIIGFFTAAGWAQISAEKLAAVDQTLQSAKASYARFDSRHQQLLNGHARLVHLAEIWHARYMRLTDPSFATVRKANGVAGSVVAAPAGIVAVSNPFNDVAYSSFGGFTQNTSAVARCGNSVVVGYNDSGSIFETPLFLTGSGGEAFSGVSYSNNGGASFTDAGPMNPGSGNGNYLGGDPVVTCTDASTFFYSQIFDYTDSGGNFFSAVAVNKSTDGGRTWGDPVPAVSKDATHLLEKPWSAQDPSKPGRMYVSYTDFDSSFSSAFCGAQVRTAIEFVTSNNGGETWSAPHVVFEVCGSITIQGSQLAVSSQGTLYISWINFGANFPVGPRQIQMRSMVPGKGLSRMVTVEANVTPGGDSLYLQGEFKDLHDMAMAVDRSPTASNGTLYITWADGRNKIVPDALGTDGSYAYDDILLRSSTDGGNTWGFAPVKVNADTQPRVGSGHDHYQSTVAVDKTGKVAACWYDRRDDNENFAIRRYCGESLNQGSSWSNTRLAAAPFAPTHGIDLFMPQSYMGDYDVLTSDFTGTYPGFIGSFQIMGSRGNPDVVVNSMQ